MRAGRAKWCRSSSSRKSRALGVTLAPPGSKMGMLAGSQDRGHKLAHPRSFLKQSTRCCGRDRRNPIYLQFKNKIIIAVQEGHLCQLSSRIRVHRAGVLASHKALWKPREGVDELKCGKLKKPRFSSREAPQ